MKPAVTITITLAAGVLTLLATAPALAQFDKLIRDAPVMSPSASPTTGSTDAKIASGLKEALQVGTQNTVSLTGKADGYLANQAIKIVLPDRLRSLEPGLRAAGFGSQVDELVVSMNRAAERAAPAAQEIFLDAIGAMTFDDAKKILNGGDTAATEYFKGKTTDTLSTAFRPIVEKTMNEVGVTRQYNALMGHAQAIPFVKAQAMDVDSYVVGKALDGLFYVLGQEEQKIRVNPAARVTDLLKETFGK